MPVVDLAHRGTVEVDEELERSGPFQWGQQSQLLLVSVTTAAPSGRCIQPTVYLCPLFPLHSRFIQLPPFSCSL